MHNANVLLRWKIKYVNLQECIFEQENLLLIKIKFEKRFKKEANIIRVFKVKRFQKKIRRCLENLFLFTS